MITRRELASAAFCFPTRERLGYGGAFRAPKVSGAVADPLWKADYMLLIIMLIREKVGNSYGEIIDYSFRK